MEQKNNPDLSQINGDNPKTDQTETITKPRKTKNIAEVTDFDYRNLTGDEFKRYNKHLETLLLNKQYDFVLMQVTPVFVERYPGLPNSPRDFNGVLLKNDTPVHTTRIPLLYAREYNAQIFNDAAKRNGKYYLLKK